MAAYTFPTVPGSYAAGDTIQFNYTGAMQTWSASNASRIKIELWGARGGYGWDTPGSGGYTYGEYLISSGNTIYVYVGGIGGDAYQNTTSTNTSNAGYNGGGDGGTGVSGSYVHKGAGGGGATDVRHMAGPKMLVAGGGGGSGTRNVQTTGFAGGGAGGGGGFMSQNGNPGYTAGARGPGLGGTQSAGGAGGAFYDMGTSSGQAGSAGSLGQGGAGGVDNMTYLQYNYAAGGGGGGYYGGGGGGSGYINTTYITKFGGESGVNFGNGYAIITILAV